MRCCFVCDSKYAINCITVWSNNWKKNDWMTSKKTKVENLEIIQEILNINKNINNCIEKSFEYFLWFGNDMADKNANI